MKPQVVQVLAETGKSCQALRRVAAAHYRMLHSLKRVAGRHIRADEDQWMPRSINSAFSKPATFSIFAESHV